MPLPTGFPGYDCLPTDLKLQIVGIAASWLADELGHSQSGTEHHRRCSLAKYACIDRVWKDTIERYTFHTLVIERSDIKKFGKTCSKRHGLLRQITLCPYPSDLDGILDQHGSTSNRVAVRNLVPFVLNDNLKALFDIMKDWSHEERSRPGFIKLYLDVTTLNRRAAHHPALRKPISIDFSGLERVEVIGEFMELGAPILDAGSIVSIYSKLPNLNRAYLNFFWQPTKAAFLKQAVDTLQLLQHRCRNTSDLTIISYEIRNPEGVSSWVQRMCQAELPIFQCLSSLSPSGTRWSDTITTLCLPCIRDVPKFLQQWQSQRTSWPQLRFLSLSGRFDSEASAGKTELGSKVIQSIIGALPKMRNLNTINIILWLLTGFHALDIDLHLAMGPKVPNDLPFVPGANKGMAVTCWAPISGQSAVALQDAVWNHYGCELEVYCRPGRIVDPEEHDNDEDDDDDEEHQEEDDDDDGWSWDTDHPTPVQRCKRWNRQKNRWDRFTSVLLSPIWKREWVLVEEADKSETNPA